MNYEETGPSLFLLRDFFLPCVVPYIHLLLLQLLLLHFEAFDVLETWGGILGDVM